MKSAAQEWDYPPHHSSADRPEDGHFRATVTISGRQSPPERKRLGTRIANLYLRSIWFIIKMMIVVVLMGVLGVVLVIMHAALTS